MHYLTNSHRVRYLTDFNDQSEPDETADELIIEGEETMIEVPEDPTTLATDDLDALHTRAVEAFEAVYGDGSDLSEEALEALGTLTEAVETLRAEQDRRAAEAAERAEQAGALAARIRPEQEEAEGEPVVEDANEGGEFSAEDDQEDEDQEAEEEEAAAEAVTASAKRPVRVNLSGLRRPRVQPSQDREATGLRSVTFAAPNVPGFSAGQSMDQMDMARVIDRRMTGMNVSAFATAARSGRRMSERFPVAAITRTFADNLTVDGDDATSALDAAVDQSRLPGNSLVASGGWCAPSETLYDLCNLSESSDLISLPEINLTRGGARWSVGPDYASIFADTGFCYTEADDAAGDYDGEGGGEKPCFHVPCPDFEEARLGYCGVCITAGLLQQRGYPEAIANFIDLALNAHAHRVSAAVINDLAAQSTEVDFPATQAGGAAPLLTAIELQATHYRAVNRMSYNATLEVVLPTWTQAVIRADLSRRLGVDLVAVSDQRIAEWFRNLNVNVQFVVDWQDIATTDAAAFTALPESISFLIYAAGTFVKGTSSSIMIENIYDSVGLGTNDYTALFTEDPYVIMKRCSDSRVVSVPFCADGSTHRGIEIACDGTAAEVTPPDDGGE